MKIKSFANSTIVYRGRGKKLVITPLSIVEVDEATFPVASLMCAYGRWLRVVEDTPKAQPKVEEVKVEEPKPEVVVEETPTVEPQPVVEEVPETEECKECVVPEVKEEEPAVVEETKEEEEPKAKKATKSKSKKK